jgi:UPF0716 protein FxsA
MMRWIVLVLIVVPALEILLFLLLGQIIGGWLTFALILLTGFIGAYLAKREFRRVFQYARHELAAGQIPATSILDGIAVFVGGLLLITPGFLTDTIGLFLLLPPTRRVIQVFFLQWLRKKIDSGQFHFYFRR